MPVIKFQRILSVSNEDKNFPAENLLKSGEFKKWKCSAGEQRAAVTLQLEKASEINKIDIGNEGSAFVEVLVGKSSMKDDEYQVILVASSFMNPTDSRSSQNLNSVRIFNDDSLSKAVCGQKWDVIKVVCSQPFNKALQYGLSFIKCYAPGNETEEKKASPMKQMTLGAFTMKSDSGDSASSLKAGSLFEKAKQKIEPVALTGAAAIREASKMAEASSATDSSKMAIEKTTDDSHKASTSKVLKTESNSQQATTKKSKPEESADPNKSKSSAPANPSSSKKSTSPPAKRKKSPSPPTKRAKTESTTSKPFNQLMSKVVFAMSGFQNPQRGHIRDRAMDMGAKYKGDWDEKCTHLICAFENTPKYNQVRGQGRIVKKDWVLDCHREKKLFPWRKYRLGKAPSPPASDNDDGDDDGAAASSSGSKKTLEKNTEAKTTKVRKPISDEDEEAPAVKKSKANPYNDSTDSECDTEDEIKKFKEEENKKKNSNGNHAAVATPGKLGDVYDASTDEDVADNSKYDPNLTNEDLPKLLDLFTGKKFFLYGNFSAEDRRTLGRYIIAYDGSTLPYMDNDVNFVVTDEKWDENFDQAISDHPHLVFVKSDWLHACDEEQRLVPYQKFIVVPQ